MTGWVSIFISVGALLITGLFVSFFIGDHIIISGLKQEKKLSEKTELEVESEETTLKEVKSELKTIETKLDKIDKEVSK